MVWPNPYEHNTSETTQPLLQRSVLGCASANDRFLAFFLDLLFFLPLNGFVFSLLFKKIETIYYHSPQSTEFIVLLGMAVVGITSLVILSRSLFQFYIGATPGQYLMKLRVVVYPKNSNGQNRNNAEYEKPSFYQLLVRNWIWSLQCFAMLFPFLEILGHDERRALHDKASETWMISLKTDRLSQSPHAIEQHFVRQFFLLSGLVVLFWGGLSLSFLYSKVVDGEFKKSELEKENYLCSQVTENLSEKSLRIDKAIALYLAGSVSKQCLENEADFLLWQVGLQKNDSKLSWSYLAKGLLNKNNEELIKSYLNKSCENNDKSEPCLLSQIYLQRQQAVDTTESKNRNPASSNKTQPSDLKKRWLSMLEQQDSETAQVTKMSLLFDSSKTKDMHAVIQSLAQKSGYDSFLQRMHVQLFWYNQQFDEARGAYQIGVYSWPTTHRVQAALWLCEQELAIGCTGSKSAGCYDWSELTHEIYKEKSYQLSDLLKDSQFQSAMTKVSHQLQLCAGFSKEKIELRAPANKR